MSKYKAARGTEDILPERVPLYSFVHSSCRGILERFGYAEIRTPLFEETRLFNRSLGETTDIVEKEMFTCSRGDTSVTFRPEATAGVVRAYLENNLHKSKKFQKLYYIGPMFRFERPQAARQRQFEQVGIEAIGSHDPRLDAEVIELGARLLEGLGLKGFEVRINSIGDVEDRDRFREALMSFVRPRLSEYCEDCQRRFERNVFRILDCKQRTCQALNKKAPAFLDHLGEESLTHFDQVRSSLEALGREFLVDPEIVRGLDYYTHTVFEYKIPDLGARNTVIGGGRYNHLVAELGGPEIPAIGFSLGVTGTLLAMEKQGLCEAHLGWKDCPIHLVSPSEGDRPNAFILAGELRAAGLCVDLDYEGKSLKAQMRTANRRGASLVLILGEDERSRGVVLVRDMRSSVQEEFPLDGDLPIELRRILTEPLAAQEANPCEDS